ncbi:MAG: 30S ribosomal protein S8 [DPANN group archaeon]|nr:30S ribosomal protein S8 [DPANN group archaeon]
MDNFANALVNIKNHELVGKSGCTLKPASKILGNILTILQKHGYIGNFELIDDGKAGQYKVQLLGTINNIKAIKPRFSAGFRDIQQYETQYLPSRGFGMLIVSTPKGLMTQYDAIQQKTGGKLLAFVY